ncbi:MAG: bifunctional phosphopantothenoylcysteine decarboxylase/phosphopantothenate--cysteine ligase CoaBC [Gaiellales bacterium]
MGDDRVVAPADGPAPVLLAVTGGIAAYRACEVVRALVRADVGVQVAMTRAARRFVGETTFAGLSRRHVLTDDPVPGGPIYPHLDAARAARVMAVAPCSANTLARLAHGLADDVVCESALALAGRLVVAPAMNHRMWLHPATQANVQTLVERGALIVGPEEGQLAEGEEGPGRLAQPERISQAIRMLLGSGSLTGKKVLVTAGGTREPLDGVRYIGNRSSGKMGVALADEALARGAEVTTILSNTQVRPLGGTQIDAPTAADVAREAQAHARDADIVLMAAAVADFRPVEAADGKRPRTDAWDLRLEPTEDVLAGIATERRPGQVIVGFAAELGEDVERARAKRERKGVDLVVLNDISQPGQGFDADDNAVVIVGETGEERLARASKPLIASGILDRVELLA